MVMKIKLFCLGLCAVLTVFTSKSSFADDWSRLVDFRGMWHFTIGDDMDWSKPKVDVSNWDRISVPGNWERYYPGYNGFGWYLKTFDMSWVPEQGDITLFMGAIDDVNEIFINGVKIGQTGNFPPAYETGYSVERKYFIQRSLLKKTGNVIAIRIYDGGGPGGIVGSGRCGIYFDEDYYLLAQDLSGMWKFSIHRDGDVYDANYKDNHWTAIHVPGYWEDQGYMDYDGTGWYRTKFTVEESLATKDDLYLVLGKIDDIDKIYLNGEQFARTEFLENYSRYNRGNAHQLYRIYKLPKSKLKKENTLVVEVRDEQQGGGIYEGPIGIMTERNARILMEREEDQFYVNPIRALLKLFDF